MLRRLYQKIRQCIYNKRHGVVKLSPEEVCRLKEYFESSKRRLSQDREGITSGELA